MKKQNLIWITVGVIIICLFIRAKKKDNVIKPGDKSSEVYGLQSALSSMTGLKFDNMGAYDTDTLNAVKYYMEGTNSLVDYESGSVDKSFASDLFLIQDKLKK